MRPLWRILSGHRAQFGAILAATSAAGGIEALLHPLLLKALFDQAILAADFGRFLALGIGYLLLGLVLNLSGYWVALWRKRFENAFVLRLETELLDRTLDQDDRTLSEAGRTSYVSRIHNDVHEGVLPAFDVCVRGTKLALSSVVFLGVLLWLSWQASLILLVIVPPLVLASNHLARQIERNTEPEREAEAQYIGRLSGVLESFHALRGLPLLRPATRAANRDALRGYLGIIFANHRLAQKQRTLSDVVMNLSDTASLIVGAFFVFTGRMTIGGFLAFVNSLWRAVTGIFDLVNMIPEARRNGAVLRRIETLRDSRRAPYHDEGPLLRVRGARVRFCGGGEKGAGAEVWIDDFQLPAGAHILLRGPNGCGKTTLLHIISGTLAPDAGTVMLPPRVASLTAPVNLPPLPVRELVPDGRLRASMGLDALAEQLPADLSSGQRQRVGIAALVCEDADVYLADEPFANLDAGGRDLVLGTLKERARGRGLIVVHHGDEDLDSHFDRVVTLGGVAARS